MFFASVQQIIGIMKTGLTSQHTQTAFLVRRDHQHRMEGIDTIDSARTLLLGIYCVVKLSDNFKYMPLNYIMIVSANQINVLSADVQVVNGFDISIFVLLKRFVSKYFQVMSSLFAE